MREHEPFKLIIETDETGEKLSLDADGRLIDQLTGIAIHLKKSAKNMAKTYGCDPEKLTSTALEQLKELIDLIEPEDLV